MKRSRRFFTHTLALLFAITVLVISGCSTQVKSVDQLMEMYEDKGHRKKIKSPFSGSVLVAKNGEVSFKGAYGYFDRENGINNTVDTKFPVGSITKQFTSVLILQLVEKGLLNLDDPISKHLNYFPEETGSQITIHHLLSNSSGLPHYDGLMRLGMDEKSFSNSVYTPKQLVELIGKTELIYEPGVKFSYSSLGYIILGAIAEEVSGMSYAELLKSQITAPLGLKDTGFESNQFLRDKAAIGYNYEETYGLNWWLMKYGGEISPASFRDQSTKFSTGGIHSTVEDLFVWSEAIRQSTLLSQEMTTRMLTPNLEGYCYGWFRNFDDLMERNTEAPMYMHGGALPGYRALISLYDDGTTVIWLANISPINEKELAHQLYLSANQLEDEYRLDGYPDWSSLDGFESEGGLMALKKYFHRLSQISGYQVLPSERSLVGIMSLYVEDGNLHVADSLKNMLFKAHKVSPDMANYLGYRFLNSENCGYALEFFEYNVINQPSAANSWDSYGDGLKACGDIGKAISCYEKAVAIGRQTQDANLSIFENNLVNAQQLLVADN